MAARLTPYELAFPADRFEKAIFPGIREEAATRGVDPSVRERLLMLATVADMLRDLGPDAGPRESGGDARLAPPDAVRDYGALLFQAFRFWDVGRRLFTLEEPLLRDLVAGESIGEWRFEPPEAAGYVQLPRHLVWARIDDEAPPEAVDGFFWSFIEPRNDRPGNLDLLLVLGMHAGRPGFSVIEAAAPLPPPSPGHWGDEDARADAADFSNILPGGELRELLAVVSTTELLKLVSRVFHYIQSSPASLRPSPPRAQDREEDAGHALPPSSIAATAITDTA